MRTKVYSIQIADAISIRDCKNNFESKLFFYDNDELFYERFKGQYIYIFKYGVVSFYNIPEDAIERICNEILIYSRNLVKEEISENIDVTVEEESNLVSIGNVSLKEFNLESLRLIMLNLSQSVVLDNYSNISEQILEDTKIHTNYLEQNGKLDISGRNLKKYIGSVLNIKNQISENLYIFDSPDVTWEDESLNKLDKDLKKIFDLKDRYRSIHDQVEIIKENLELFKDIMFQKESSKLEWTIIILILVEVIDMFVVKIL